MIYDFTATRIVITGITGGIAKATTQLLSSLGAEVIVTARSHEKLERSLADFTGKVSDLLIAFSIAPFIGVADHLAAQWYVPAFVGPFMIVAHVACLAACFVGQGKIKNENKQFSRLQD